GRHQPDGLGHVIALVEPGTEQFQLAPEIPVQVDLARLGVDRHHDQASPRAEYVDGGGNAGGRAGDLEGDVRARTVGALVDQRDHVVGGRVHRLDADLIGHTAPERIRLGQNDVGSTALSDCGDQDTDGPAADDD